MRQETESRKVYIKKVDFERHGYTEGCEGCRRMMTGSMTLRPHTRECRDRMEKLMQEEDHPRWRRAVNRREEDFERAIHEEERKMQEEENHEEEHDGSDKRDRNQGDEGSVAKKLRSEKETGKRRQGDDRNEEERNEKRQRQEAHEGENNASSNSSSSSSQYRDEEGDLEMRSLRTNKIEGLLKCASVDVMEVRFPSGVGKEARKFGLEEGEAIDMTTGWDFRINEHRERDEKYVREKKPFILIGSPECAILSQMQSLSKWGPEKETRYMEAIEHAIFMIKLYRIQHEEGRVFLHEHPAKATSWKIKEVQSLAAAEGIYVTKIDQCMYGLRTQVGRNWMAAKKPSKFMANSKTIAGELNRKCDKAHVHQPLTEGRAKETRQYPPELCRAICRGIMKEKRERRGNLKAVTEVRMKNVEKMKLPDPEEFHDREEIRGLSGSLPWDDLTSMKLEAGKVIEARAKEIQYTIQKRVYKKIPRREAVSKGWKIIKTRWLDINKGDDESPVYRSRMVGKEFNDGEMDGIFAGTPPLEALRYLLHDAATWNQNDDDPDEKIIMVNDVARAFFEAKATRPICIEIPKEDMTPDDERRDVVGFLLQSLYGTRDAAMNWQEEVRKEMKAWGFKQGVYNPCLYTHPHWKLKVMVHGDDFVTVGKPKNVEIFEKQISERFEIKTSKVGRYEGCAKEARVLNRVIRWTDTGWEYEPDQRHAELIMEDLGMSEAKAVSTPSEPEKRWEEEENQQVLEGAKATQFRKVAARLNYLAADRPDLMFAAKEVCRKMAVPTVGGWKKLKRVARYLVGRPRAVLKYGWQGREEEVLAYTDADWAGCKSTGRSTSGGALMIGSHFLKGWCRNQASVTLSSAESELVAMCKTSAEALGILAMMKDLGEEAMYATVYADSSAALAIASRKGSGKLRHINVGLLWLQEKESQEELVFAKVVGADNPADAMTKGVKAETLDKHVTSMSQQFPEGRAKEGLNVQSGKISLGGKIATLKIGRKSRNQISSSECATVLSRSNARGGVFGSGHT